MGSGKTTLGRLLAKTLNKTFYDVDHEIETRTGVNIPWIFDVEGEQGFRQREQLMLNELAQLSDIVLATGGGTVINEINRKILQQYGYVIYLQTTVEQQLQRIAGDSRRPLLQTDDQYQRLKDLLKQREAFYHEVADCTINTQNITIQALLKKVLKHCM